MPENVVVTQTQLLVIGGGPGGYAAAFYAADMGMEVTLVDADERLGGTCLLRGCIPSKTLLHVARVISEAEELTADWGVKYQPPTIDLEALRGRKMSVIETLSDGLAQLAKRRKVRWIRARARFDSSTSVVLEGDDPAIPPDGRLTFQRAIIAAGSRPVVPASLSVDSDRVIDSTGALALQDIPETMLVVGGGYIGLEMATVYASLGSRVSVVELTEGLLPGADRDLVKPLAGRLEKLFEGRIYLNTRVGSLGDRDGKVEAAFEGPGKFGVERFDRVLVSIGRRPNTDRLGLEKTAVQVGPGGFIEVDASRRTDDPHIWAIGDVTPGAMLAHKAAHEAKVAVESILGHDTEFRPAGIPAVVFTDPEIAWVGLTADQAKQQQIDAQVVMYPWAASGRARAIGRVEGLTKWIVDPKTERILGCGLVGPGAGELISEATLALEMGCHLRDLTETIHPHPTLSETLMNAAEVFYGTATEIYKPRREKK